VTAPIVAAPEVLARAMAGDPDAFAALYREHRRAILLFILDRVGDRATAEDVASEVWIKAWRGIGTFTWKGSGIDAWLRAIARNLVIDHYRAVGRRPDVSKFDNSEALLAEKSSDADARPEETVAGNLDALTLISVLPPAQRAVLTCRFFRDLSVADTATALGKTRHAVIAIQHRAMQTLAGLTQPQNGR